MWNVPPFLLFLFAQPLKDGLDVPVLSPFSPKFFLDGVVSENPPPLVVIPPFSSTFSVLCQSFLPPPRFGTPSLGSIFAGSRVPLSAGFFLFFSPRSGERSSSLDRLCFFVDRVEVEAWACRWSSSPRCPISFFGAIWGRWFFFFLGVPVEQSCLATGCPCARFLDQFCGNLLVVFL